MSSIPAMRLEPRDRVVQKRSLIKLCDRVAQYGSAVDKVQYITALNLTVYTLHLKLDSSNLTPFHIPNTLQKEGGGLSVIYPGGGLYWL